MADPRVPQPSPSMESGEKVKAFQEDHVLAAGLDVSQVDERKLVRKIDLRLIPWLSLLYLLSFLDRTSIGNAKVFTCYFLCDGRIIPPSIALWAGEVSPFN
jgi:hypothetical protein